MSFPTSPTNGQQATVNGIVYNYNSTKGAWIKNVTTAGTLTTGNLVITSNIASTSTLNGALVVTGGIGISRNLNAGSAGSQHRITGNVGIGTLGSADGSALTIQRVVSIADYRADFNLISPGGATLSFNSNTSGGSYNPLTQNRDAQIYYSQGTMSTGSLIVGQWSDSPRGFRIDGTGVFEFGSAGNVVVANTTASASATTGALVVRGGVGISGALNVASRGITRGSMPAGSILQVVHTAKTNTFSGTSVPDNGGYFIDVTGLSATITPSSSTSTILVITDMYIGVTNTSSGYQNTYRLKRTIGGTTTFPILGDAEGGRPRATGRINQYIAAGTVQYHMAMMSGTHMDSPATTSAITYQVQLGGYSAAPAVYLNRSETFQVSANDYDNVPVSTITLMEIAA
jgi:hypothetical protein